MRHDEAGLVEDFIAVQNQIEVDGARSARMRPLAPEPLLDLEQSCQQRARVE
jgi:hypothetical protein